LKESIYELSVSGWEGYSPVWFKSGKSKTAFKRVVREAIHSSLPLLTKKDKWGYDLINGHDLKEKIVPILEEKGFERVNPDLEVGLNGDCIYNRGRGEKPEIIARADWKTIVEHNEMTQKSHYDKMEKKHKNRSKKRKKEDAKEKLESIERTIETLTKSLANAKIKKAKYDKQIK